MSKHYFSYRFLSPRYWPIWVAVGLLRVIVFLPYRVLVALGEGLGLALYHLRVKHRRIAATNIALAFPRLSPREQADLVKATFKSTMVTLFELPLFWWARPARLKRLYTLEGREHLDAALAMGKGAIMMGGHFTPMLMCGRMLAMEVPFNILVLPAKNDLFEAIMRYYRERYYAGIINSSDIRGMVKALKRNQVCWYSPDQDLGSQGVVFAPFMGVPAATLTATARLAKLSGAPIVPITFQRRADRSGYLIQLGPHWTGFPTGDDVADATRVNQFIEGHVHTVPEQYLWVHRRYKTRPVGEKGFY